MAECIISGRQGPKGDTGPQGEVGPQGPTGPANTSAITASYKQSAGGVYLSAKQVGVIVGADFRANVMAGPGTVGSAAMNGIIFTLP